MIDASDHGRLQEAQEELAEVLEDEVMKGVPCLILANKQDRLGVMGVNDLAERLNLREIHGRPWHIKVNIGIPLVFCTNEVSPGIKGLLRQNWRRAPRRF